MTESIIELAEQEARKRGANRVNRIKLRIGEFTGVVKEALEFSFDAVKSGTLAEFADLEIEVIPLRSRCGRCGTVTATNGGFSFTCPDCAGPVEIVCGRELQIEYIDLA